jgi:anti-sigma regulatory factor (Ser/Thr protein kinase)
MTSREPTVSNSSGLEIFGDGDTRSFLVPPDMAVLTVLRQHLLSALTGVLPPGDLDLYVVAISEAATNALEAHCRRGLAEPVTVTVDLASARTTVEDRGGRIDPSTVEPAEVAPSAVRGRGLLIMRGICPSLEIQQTDSGVTVVLPFPA